MAANTTAVEIEYPERDGRPTGETDIHRDWIMRLILLLQHRFQNEKAYVSGDLLLYYIEGDTRTFIVPDVFVTKDHPPGRRRVYKLWEEGKTPNFVCELTSLSTQREDVSKLKKYSQIGVAEVFLFDPTGDYLSPPLQGYKLASDDYEAIRPNSTGRLYSAELNAELCLEESRLVLYDHATRQCWLTADEAARAERAVAEAKRATAEAGRAAAEANRAAAEAERDSHEARAEELEAEVQRLREQLRLQGE